jgi:O-antigen/teichoic acid export membrane protein
VRRTLVTLLRQTVVYGVSGAVLPLVGLVTLPVFARRLSPPQFGVLELATVTAALLYVFVDLGLAGASQRAFFDYTDHDQAQRRSVMRTALLSSVATGCVIAGGLVIFAAPVASLLLGSQRYDTVIVLIGVTLPLTAVTQFTREAMRLTFRPWQYTTSAILGGAVAGGVGVAAVVAWREGVAGVFWGLLAGNALTAVYGLAVVRRGFAGRTSLRELRSMLAYGMPLLPAAVTGWGLVFVDRFILGALSTLGDVGQYGVANRVVSALAFIVTAFSLAFSPYILGLYSEDRELERKVRAHVFMYLTVVLMTAGVVLSLFSREIIDVIAPSYTSAYESVPLLSAGTVAFGIGAIAMTGISLVRATRWFAIYSCAAFVLNVALNVALVPAFGQVGAAAATLGAYAALTALYYRKAQELYPAPFDLGKLLRTICLGALAMSAGLIRIQPLGIALAVQGAVLIAFLVLLWRLRIVGAREFTAFRATVQSARSYSVSEA